MEISEKFKKVECYGSNGKLSDEEQAKLGVGPIWMTVDECAYQCAYDLSNDWVKDNPTWDDVEAAYKKGVEDGIKYANSQG